MIPSYHIETEKGDGGYFLSYLVPARGYVTTDAAPVALGDHATAEDAEAALEARIAAVGGPQESWFERAE